MKKYCIFLIMLCFATAAFSQNPLLLKDIFTGTASSAPAEIVRTSNYIFFNAEDNDADTDKGLYRTDGTTAGTIRINLTDTTYLSTGASKLTALGNKIIFAGDNLNFYGEIWVSDGTQVGTRALERFQPATYSANANRKVVMDMALVNSSVLYSVRSNNDHLLLKKTNGTPGAMELVYDFGVVANTNAQVTLFKTVNNILYFIYYDGADIDQLWRSDGTTAGTYMVKDFTSVRYVASNLMPAGIDFYIMMVEPGTGNVLWKSDGTASGTVSVKTIGTTGNNNYPPNAAIGSTLYFAGLDNTNGKELWKTDGTSGGTVLVSDINSGIANSDPNWLTVLNNQLYFTATSAATGTEIWKYDGATSILLKDIYPGTTGSSPTSLALSNNRIVFGAVADTTFGNEFWMTDGTAANTTLAADIATGSASSTPGLITTGNPVYFVAGTAATGRELYKYDNTTSFTPHKLYVNDSSTTTDIFTTAIGNNNNSGAANAPFATITYALSRAVAGDSIMVDAGIFTEQVTITKSITIMGSGNNSRIAAPDSGLVAAPGFGEKAVVQSAIFSGNIHLKNLKISGNGQASNVHAVMLQAGGSVANCTMQNANLGVYFRNNEQASNVVIENNNIDSVVMGVNCQGTGMTVIARNNNIQLKATYPFSAGFYVGLDFGPITAFTSQNNFVANYRNEAFWANSGNTIITNNSIVGFSGTAIKQTSGAATIATCNWYGSAEPDAWASPVSGNVTYTPWLTSGVDNDTSIGFQPIPGTCTGKRNKWYVNDTITIGDVLTAAAGNNANVGSFSRPFATLEYAFTKIQNGDTLFIDAGNYPQPFPSWLINKSVAILGSNYLISPNDAVNSLLSNAGRNTEAIISGGKYNIGANDISIKGFTLIAGADTAIILRDGPVTYNNLNIQNNRFMVGGTSAISITGRNVNPANTNFNILNNRFEKTDTLFGTSIFFAGCNNVNINGNTHILNGGTPNRQSALFIIGPTTGTSNNFTYNNNYGDGVRIGFGLGNRFNTGSIQNNYFINTQVGIQVNTPISQNTNFTIAGNKVLNFIDLGISYIRSGGTLAGSNKVTITNNEITYSATGKTSSVFRLLNIFHGPTVVGGNVICKNNTLTVSGNFANIPSTNISGIEVYPGPVKTFLLNANQITFSGTNATTALSDSLPTLFPSGILVSTDGGGSPMASNGNLEISNNAIHGFKQSIEFIDIATSAGNTPVTGYGLVPGGAIVNINNNSFTGDSVSINNGTTSQVVNANCNWYGSSNANTVANKISQSTVRYTPFLSNGTDADHAIGFQPVAGSCINISSFTPSESQAGTFVTIKGFGFNNVNAVQFNGSNASGFTVLSDTAITATVPANAVTGTISIIAASASVTSANNFMVIPNATADSISICPGSNAVLLSSISGSSYQWKLVTDSGNINIANGINYSGVTTDTLRLLNVPATATGSKFVCLVSGGTLSKTLVVSISNKWNGGSATDWNNPLNWGCSGKVPDINTSVIITSGSVIVNTNSSAKSVFANPGTIVTIGAGANLIIKNQ